MQSLQLWLAEALAELYHSNGQPLIKLFGQHHRRDVSVQSCIFQASAQHCMASEPFCGPGCGFEAFQASTP